MNMLLLYLLLLEALLNLTTATMISSDLIRHSSDLIRHERRNAEEARGWVKGTRVKGHVQLPVRIGLQQSAYAMKNAHDWLMDVSHPSSKKYGQHWTQDEVIEAFKPPDDTLNAVKHWLLAEGVVSEDRITHTDNKAWFAFDASAETMETLLRTQFHEYHHEASGEAMISCDEYRVPAELVDHIDYITPGVKGVKLQKRKANTRLPKRTFRSRSTVTSQDEKSYSNNTLGNCDKLITPACIQALYHFQPQDPHAQVSLDNSLGIFEASTSYRPDDLNKFFRKFTPYIPQGTRPIFHGIDGGVTPAETRNSTLDPDNAEADLDFECAIPIIYPQTATEWQTDDQDGGGYPGIFNTFFDAIDGSYCTYSAYGETGDAEGIDPKYPDPSNGQYTYHGKLQCGVFKPTNVVTFSYTETELGLPFYYQKRQCNEALKLGLQGVSLFADAGDFGVGCFGNNGTFSPSQASHDYYTDVMQFVTCPYVTAVGATRVKPNSTVFEPEVAAANTTNKFYSGGGFSNIFDVPEYQKSAIAEYFRNHNPPYQYYENGNFNGSHGRYNRNGRGLPDVSAIGQNIATYIFDKPAVLEGTSASSPIFASLINRIIEERIKVGKGPVGLVNPVLYSHPEVLNDITEGSNPNCGTPGFSAEPGWDPVTGLGTPNYPKMLELFLSLP